MGGVALVRTTFGWPKYGSRWHVLDEREPNDNWAPVDQQYLLLVMVLQPANSGDFVPRDYKSSASKQYLHRMSATNNNPPLAPSLHNICTTVCCLPCHTTRARELSVAYVMPQDLPCSGARMALLAGAIEVWQRQRCKPRPQCCQGWLLPDEVPSPALQHYWHPLRGNRIGEATNPGPDKRLPMDQDPSEDESLTHLQTRRRLLHKGPDALPPVPDDEDLQESLPDMDATMQDTAIARLEPAAQPRTLLKLMVSRAQGGPPVLLSAAWISGKRSWRWQIRAAPAIAGTERAHPAASLDAFYQRHRDALSSDAEALIQAKIQQLQEHEAPAYAPEAARRIRSDLQRYAVPAAPEDNGDRAGDGTTMPTLQWSQILRVATSRIPMERHIPHCLQGLTREVIRLCARNLVAADAQEAPYGALLFVLPKLAWPSHAVRPEGTKPHGRQRQKIISARLQRLLEGQGPQILVGGTLERGTATPPPGATGGGGPRP